MQEHIVPVAYMQVYTNAVSAENPYLRKDAARDLFTLRELEKWCVDNATGQYHFAVEYEYAGEIPEDSLFNVPLLESLNPNPQVQANCKLVAIFENVSDAVWLRMTTTTEKQDMAEILRSRKW